MLSAREDTSFLKSSYTFVGVPTPGFANTLDLGEPDARQQRLETLACINRSKILSDIPDVIGSAAELAGVGNVRVRVRQRGRVLSGDGGLRVRVMCGCGLSGCGESAGVGNVAGGGFVWVWVERVRGKCGGGGNEGCGETAGRKKAGCGETAGKWSTGAGKFRGNEARVRGNCG